MTKTGAFLLTAVLFALPAFGGVDDALDRLDELLARYTAPDGVRYAAWKAATEDLVALDGVVADLSAIEPLALPVPQRWAHYTNLYNAFTLQMMLEAYPVESIRDLGRGKFGFEIFSRKQVTLGSERIALDELEKRLRKESDDPRVHFAVNCASRSCPPLMQRAYRGATWNEELDRMSRAYLARPEAIRLSGGETLTVEISKIFKWYKDDFDAAAGGVRGFLEQFAPAGAADFIQRAKRVKFVYPKYDWSINSLE